MKQSPSAKTARHIARKVRLHSRRADKAHARKLRRSRDARRNPELEGK